MHSLSKKEPIKVRTYLAIGAKTILPSSVSTGSKPTSALCRVSIEKRFFWRNLPPRPHLYKRSELSLKPVVDAVVENALKLGVSLSLFKRIELAAAAAALSQDNATLIAITDRQTQQLSISSTLHDQLLLLLSINMNVCVLNRRSPKEQIDFFLSITYTYRACSKPQREMH